MSLARALALVALVTLPGCASLTASSPQAESPRPATRRAADSDRVGTAYYHYSVAQMHARAGRMPDALTEIRQAIQSDPRSAALWTQLAQWLARSNQPGEAIAAAQKAVELEPENTGAYLTLAELYRRARRLPEAEAALEKVITIAPRSPEAYLALAQQHFEQKSYDKARAVLLRLVERAARACPRATTCWAASRSRRRTGTRPSRG